MKLLLVLGLAASLSGCVAVGATRVAVGTTKTAAKTTVGVGKVATRTTVGAGKVVYKGGRAVVVGGED